MVKQRIYLHGSEGFCTSLHIAAEYGNISAIELLVDRDANVDECDSGYLSPLECILLMNFADGHNEAHKKAFDKRRATNAAVRLIQLGAAKGTLLSWSVSRLLETLINATGFSELLFTQIQAASHMQTPPVLHSATVESSDWERLFRCNTSRLQNYVLESEEYDVEGKGLKHEAICWRGFSALPPRWNNALQAMDPFPWHNLWPHRWPS